MERSYQISRQITQLYRDWIFQKASISRRRTDSLAYLSMNDRVKGSGYGSHTTVRIQGILVHMFHQPIRWRLAERSGLETPQITRPSFKYEDLPVMSQACLGRSLLARS